MRAHQLGTITAGLAVIISSAAAAQVAPDTAKLKELVVTATRIPEPPEAVTASVTVITGEELKSRGIRFLQDALRQVPSAAVVQSGSYGGVSSLFLRGGESDYVKVLIDGVPVNQSGGAYSWANLTTDNIDRVEILRGPASVVYGSDAVTGVVQVFTRTGEGRLGLEGSAEAGSFGSVLGHGAILGGSPGLSYSAAASRIATDGTYPFNNDYGNTVLSGAVRSHPDRQSDISLAIRFSDNQYHFPTDFSGALADSNQFNAEQAIAIGVELARRMGDRYELRLSGGGSRTDGEFDDLMDSAGDTLGFGFASHRDSRGDRGNLDARITAFISPVLALTAGSQVERETERQSGVSTSNFGGITTTPDIPFDEGRTTFGYYIEGVLDLPSGLSVDLNGRLDDNSAFGTFATYRAGAAYRFESHTRVRVSAGTAFKAPTFCEQFCNAPFVVGDPGLEPERSSSWEIGLEQQLLSSRLLLVGTYFDQRFHDMIVYDGSVPPGTPTYVNGAAAKARGIEAGFRASLADGIIASASYTYLLAEATDDAGLPTASFAAGEPLTRRPNHAAQMSVRAQVADRVTLGGSLSYVGHREDVDFSQFPSLRVSLAPYAIVDLAGEIEIIRGGAGTPALSVTLRAENVFDKEYDQVVGFPGRPRGVFGGAGFRF